MPETVTDPLEYYARPGPMTDPKEQAHLLERLPAELSALCQVVQGLLIHIYWAERYGVKLAEERRQELQMRAVAPKLARIRELDGRPLIIARPPERRLASTCRDYAVLLCAMLRHQGLPARARCGFARYFRPNRYEDHWVCECWKAEERRWAMVDAQLDQLQREALGIRFDPLDVPEELFLTGGRAWLVCRAGQADPDHFGVANLHGMGFVGGNVVRDFLALNKVELLPWDGGWGLLISEGEKEVGLLDRVATLTLAGDGAFSELRRTYEKDSRFHIPRDWE